MRQNKYWERLKLKFMRDEGEADVEACASGRGAVNHVIDVNQMIGIPPGHCLIRFLIKIHEFLMKTVA